MGRRDRSLRRPDRPQPPPALTAGPPARPCHAPGVTVVPLPGTGPQRARDVIAAALLAAANIRTGGLTPVDRLNAYRAWSTQTATALHSVLRPSDIDRLVTTPRHWHLHALDFAAHGDAAGLVDLELTTRSGELQTAVDSLDHILARRKAQRGDLVVADTNVYLHHPMPFDKIDWPGLVPGSGSAGLHLVIPIVVVDELDRQKQGDSKKYVIRGGTESVRTRARTTIRTLEDMFQNPGWISTVRPGTPPVAAELFVDPPGHVRHPDADTEIIDRACAVRDLYGAPVTLVARDTGMVFRARNAGLAATRLPDPPDD